jgi:hypothetical protein
MQRERRMPSGQGCIRAAWYAIFMMLAVVFVLPTGPMTSETKDSEDKKAANDSGGV